LRYAIITFGCRANQADSFGFEGELRGCGAEAARIEHADLVLVNTCSVTAPAEQGARQTIRRIARANPAAKIIVTGCYATRRPAEISSLPGVARLVSNEDRGRLLSSIGPDLGLTTAERFAEGEDGCGLALAPGVQGRTAYFLRAQTGCDERCAYCIIPSTRGPSRSRPLEAIVAEADRAATAGFKELILTGVHLGAYGRDFRPRRSLLDLLGALDGGGGDRLYRLSAIEPMDCPPAIIDLLAQSGRFAPHVHLPLQHASGRMLDAMGRRYSAQSYRRTIDLVRERVPEAAIGTDLIAGFPGETENDFRRCLDFLNEAPLTSVHVFPYSDRPGTAAAAMTPKVDGRAVLARASALRARGRELHRRFQHSQVGRVRRGLTLEDGTLVLTDNYLKVRVPPGHARNEWVDVKLMAAGEPMTGVVVGGH